MSAPSLPRIAWIVVGALLLAAGPVRGQPDEAKKSVADKHVDHEGLPLPAEAIARVGSARFRAVGLSPDVAYTPDAKTIVSVVRRNASGRDLIQFWAAETGKVRHETSVKMAFFAPGLTFLGDGKMLYLDEQLTCHALDCCQNAKELWKRKLQVGKDVPPGRPTCVRFSPQGSHVAVRWRFERLALFELAQGRQIGSLNPKIVDNQLNINGQSVAFSPDGTALAVASPDNRIEIFDAADLKKRLVIEAPLKSVDDVAFSADGRHLLCTGHNECSVLIRDWANKQQVVRLDALIQYGVQAFSPDGHHLVGYTGPAHGLICFDLETGKEVRRIAFGSQCSMVAFSPDGQTLLAGNRNGAIGQWDFKSGNPLLASADPFDGLRVVRFSGDGKHLLAFTDRHVLMDWRSGGAPTACAAAETPDRRFATLSPDATLLAVRKDKDLLLLDAQSGKQIRRLGVPGGNVGLYLFGGNNLFTSGSDQIVRMWELQKPEPVRMLRDPGPGNLLAASGDGRYFAAAAAGQLVTTDRDVRIWDNSSEQPRHRFTPRHGAAYRLMFSPRGHELAILTAEPHRNPDEAEVVLVDVRTGAEKRVIALLDMGAQCLAFSPDGHMLATADRLGALRLWEVATGKERHRFEGHKNSIDSIAFSKDGALLASSSAEAPAYIWDVYGKHTKHPPSPWPADEPQRLWAALSDSDAKAGFQAMRRLVQNPSPAIALLRDNLKPAQPVDVKRVQQWLLDLEGDDFMTRQAAVAKLEKLGDAIDTPLQKALTAGLGLEARRRVQAIVAKFETLTPDRLARSRALETLEQIATPEAVRLLESLAKGEPAARLTREARESLERIRKR